jgi:hypothetical protein
MLHTLISSFSVPGNEMLAKRAGNQVKQNATPLPLVVIWKERRERMVIVTADDDVLVPCRQYGTAARQTSTQKEGHQNTHRDGCENDIETWKLYTYFSSSE